MAKKWAKKFYDSKAWETTRAAYIESVDGLCERCGEAGYIVHHKVYLTAKNINDPNVTLSYDNLEYLCWLCHNREHHGDAAVTVSGLAFDEDGNLIQIENFS